jgi:hypothetical protein
VDRIDALGKDHNIDVALTRALLAETEDSELNSIVEEAAQELSAPIALVTLVLDQIQFFKTHYGLPSELATARGTDRDVSFCQFVVKSGKPFEVTNAKADKRIPQHLVERYNIQSYLGMPVEVDGSVLGSICVIDTQPRDFSEKERSILRKLSVVANRRLANLSEKRKGLWAALLPQASEPALAELRNCLTPIQDAVATGSLAAVQAGPALRLALRMLSDGTNSLDTLRRGLETTQRALESCQCSFDDIEASLGDASDSLTALENALTNTSLATLSTIALSGRELARHSVESVGGATLPDMDDDPVVTTPRPLGVTLIATCLSMVAGLMSSKSLSGGILMDVRVLGSQAEITISCKDAVDIAYETIAAELKRHSGDEPTVAVQATDGAVSLRLAVAKMD